MERFAPTPEGPEDWTGPAVLPRHFHHHAYATIVLSGEYEESGGSGRFRLVAGDVVLHAMFDAHLDRFGKHGARLFNLALPRGADAGQVGQVADPDAILRAAEISRVTARDLLLASVMTRPPPCLDWMDKLAGDIQENAALRLSEWADAMGMAPETVSRGFGAVFGVSPARFRAETRARQAFTSITAGSAPLAEVALATGFADQAHMTRAVRDLTGAPPSAWRPSNPFKTGRAAPP